MAKIGFADLESKDSKSNTHWKINWSRLFQRIISATAKFIEKVISIRSVYQIYWGQNGMEN